MKFLSITLENYGAFLGKHTFSFARFKPGLYYVKGRNDREPSISPNGAGKSTLLGSIIWVLFGETPRGVRAGAVRTWKAKAQAAVTLVGEAAGRAVTVRRAWSPNELTLDSGEGPKPIDQEDLERALGVRYATVKDRVLVPQLGDLFFDMLPSEQLAVLSEVLQLGYWTDCSERAADAATAYENAARESHGRIGVLNERLYGYAQQIKDDQNAQQSFNRDWSTKKDDLTHAAETALRRVEDHELVVADLKKTSYQRDLKLVDASIAALEERQETARNRTTKTAKSVGAARERVSALMDQRDDLNKLGARCPLCAQPVTARHRRDEIERIERLIDDAKDALSKAEVDQRADEGDAHRITSDLSSAQAARSELFRKDNVLKSDQRHSAARLDTLRQELRDAKNRLEDHRKERDPFAAKIKLVERDIDKANTELAEVRRDHAANETALAGAEFWVKGFKDLRLQLIRESLMTFEVGTNAALVALGLGDWNVHCDVARETKKGTIATGVNMTVTTAEREDVPYKTLSGGEAGRVKLGGAIGYMAMLDDVLGDGCNIEIWDEPGQHLSTVEPLIELLRDRAHQSGKVIFFIDQVSHDSGMFDGTVTVIKDDNGSRIEGALSSRAREKLHA